MQGNKKPVFVTFFPDLENEHLTKDIGMIPDILQNKFGYSSYIMCYRNGEYPRLKTETSNLKLCFIKKNWLHTHFDRRISNNKNLLWMTLGLLLTMIDLVPAMMKHAKKIDVLQLYHLKYESIILGRIYKLINPRGTLYLKMDANPLIIDQYSGDRRQLLKRSQCFYSLKKFDIISAESQELITFLRRNHPLFQGLGDKLFYLPNGLNLSRLSGYTRPIKDKENIILHVARMGIYEKGSDIILNAYQNIAREFPDWKLVLIGAMENDFKGYFNDYLAKNQDIRDNIDYQGFIEERGKLFEYYSKAKIIAIPSRSESFCFAAIEGGYFGDVIVGSNLPPLREYTDNGRLGYLCEIDNVQCYEKTLRQILKNDAVLEDKSSATSELIRKTYDWDKICQSLDKIIREKLERKI